MTALVFFIGPAAAGKTTLAKALVKTHKAAFLDMDTLLRPAAEAIMTALGLDPNDRDSPVYKKNCRDLGYRITMDAAVENLQLGIDTFVIGPFTKEIEDPQWLEQELARAGLSMSEVHVKVIYVYLPSDYAYQSRLRERGSEMDIWKLDNWETFRSSLFRREVKWPLSAGSVRYWDNSGELSAEKLAQLQAFMEMSPE
ncbi:AAA family ATPase [Paenibacillus aestuarii]|uniref:AAA family ATPase n=1 Tax=Paenibacillus aestuarii TaxID=516965 RepID=A0ABW0KC22_9BACL|nr:AAA family ATPase [Paenibacillus aestuarii]